MRAFNLLFYLRPRQCLNKVISSKKVYRTLRKTFSDLKIKAEGFSLKKL